MNPVEEYIDNLPQNQRGIMILFHDIFVKQFQLKANIKWRVPTYFGTTWVFYMNPDKKSQNVHLCFFRGNELSNQYKLLKSNGRKMVKSILISDLEKIPMELLIESLEEAVYLDKTVKFKMPKKN